MSTVAVLAVGAAVVLVLPIAWRVAQRRVDPFEPIVVFALAWGVIFVVRPFAIVIREDWNFYGVDIQPTLEKSVLLGLVGAVGFVVGHELPLGRKLPSRLPGLPRLEASSRTLTVAVIVGVLATACLFVFLLLAGGTEAVRTFFEGRSPEFNEILRGSPLYLWWLSVAVVPATLVAFVVAYELRTPSALLALAFLLVLVFLRIVPTGNRGYLLMLLGTVVVYLYVRVGRRPGVLTLVAGLLLALFVSRAVLEIRYTETRANIPTLLRTLALSPSRAFSPLYRGADAEMAPALAGALLAIPSELPYRYGAATLGDLAARPVPRHLWPGKPEPHVNVVTARVWPVARETGDFQPAYTPVLSFFWDLWLPGVFVGMALYGWIARLVLLYLGGDRGNPTAHLACGLALWTLVVAVRGDPVQLVFHVLILFGPLVAMARFGGRESLRRPQDAAAA